VDKFTLELSPAAIRDLDKLEDKGARMILAELTVLKDNPFPRGKLIKKIKGKKTNFYRLRVGKYRVFFCIEGAVVVVLKVIGKKDAGRFIKNL